MKYFLYQVAPCLNFENTLCLYGQETVSSSHKPKRTKVTRVGQRRQVSLRVKGGERVKREDGHNPG